MAKQLHKKSHLLSLSKDSILRRRAFLKRLGLGTLWWLFFPCFLKASLAKEEETFPLSSENTRKKGSIGEAFAGEKLEFNVSFWWFKKAAKARIAFHRKEEGGYLASIEAETLGFIGWVTRYRKDIYYTHIEETDGGKRLVSHLFEYQVTLGKKTRRSYIKFDYESSSMVWKSWGGGKPESIKREEISPGVRYDDPLVAFYNFRYAAYGPLEEGREFHIRTFPKKGVSTIYVRITTEDEKRKRLNPLPEGVEYLVDARIEKELFGSQTGDIEILFSKDFTPLIGIVKDIIFFGDIKGVLTKKVIRKSMVRNLRRRRV